MDLVFDDQPVESILYDKPCASPTPASLFATTAPTVSAIVRGLHEGAVEEPLRRLGELLARGDPVKSNDLCRVAGPIRGLLPQVPCPIVENRGLPYGALLQPIFSASLEYDEDELVAATGMTLYRYYEGVRRYADGVRVIAALLERAKKKLHLIDEAVFTNNLGYEHFLDRDWERAEPCFVRAIELFTQADATFDRNNSRLNLLACRYERSDGQTVEGFEPEVSQLQALLAPNWLQRKALILLARISERRGDLKAAIRFTRKAVKACKDVPTWLRLEDQEYLKRLTAP